MLIHENLAIICENEEQHDELQDYLLSLGYRWPGNEQEKYVYDQKFPCIEIHYKGIDNDIIYAIDTHYTETNATYIKYDDFIIKIKKDKELKQIREYLNKPD